MSGSDGDRKRENRAKPQVKWIQLLDSLEYSKDVRASSKPHARILLKLELRRRRHQSQSKAQTNFWFAFDPSLDLSRLDVSILLLFLDPFASAKINVAFYYYYLPISIYRLVNGEERDLLRNSLTLSPV